jgi:hypothetical protein
MNRIERHGRGGLARLRFLDGDFQVVTPGSFVRCAVTGLDIPLDELKYWSVERQEAYVDAAASLSRHRPRPPRENDQAGAGTRPAGG